jgi:hypothetical protein
MSNMIDMIETTSMTRRWGVKVTATERLAIRDVLYLQPR